MRSWNKQEVLLYLALAAMLLLMAVAGGQDVSSAAP